MAAQGDKTKGNDGSVKQANESGEPREAGRTRGKQVEQHGSDAGSSPASPSQGKSKTSGKSAGAGDHPESGRHDATP